MKQVYRFIKLFFIVVLILPLFNGCVLFLESDDHTSEEQWLVQVYGGTFTFETFQKQDLYNSWLTFYSSNLEKSVTVKRITTDHGFNNVTYSYYSNYNQLEYEENEKTLILDVFSPYFQDDYPIDYGTSGLYLIQVVGDSDTFGEWSRYCDLKFQHYTQWPEWVKIIDEETNSVFIKTPDDADLMEKYMKNITSNFQTKDYKRNIVVYFAQDIAAAKTNPVKGVADRKYIISANYSASSYSREF